jgi:hypothetical protein
MIETPSFKSKAVAQGVSLQIINGSKSDRNPEEVQKQPSKKMVTYYHHCNVQRFHQIENYIQNLNNLQGMKHQQ